MSNLNVLAARLLLAQIFLLSGMGKLGEAYAVTQAYMESMGMPGLLLPLVIMLEIGGGLALICGWQTRWAALALAGFSLIGAMIFHHNFADQNEMIMFMKDFAMAGGLLLLSVHGAGALSVDVKILSRDA
jgi:putative oxidoreductase